MEKFIQINLTSNSDEDIPLVGMYTLMDDKTKIKYIDNLIIYEFNVPKIKTSCYNGSNEYNFVALLDADKEGFLRSERSLIQTIGRAARNTDGKVIMYADELTESMEKAISETNRRRKIQEQYNKDHGIIPKTIQKAVRDTIKASFVADVQEEYKLDKDVEIKEIISKMTDEMLKYAANMEFEKAAEIRDKIKELEKFYK